MAGHPVQPAGGIGIREIQMFGDAQEMQTGSVVDDGREADFSKNRGACTPSRCASWRYYRDKQGFDLRPLTDGIVDIVDNVKTAHLRSSENFYSRNFCPRAGWGSYSRGLRSAEGFSSQLLARAHGHERAPATTIDGTRLDNRGRQAAWHRHEHRRRNRDAR
jgi:hypothetical protein